MSQTFCWHSPLRPSEQAEPRFRLVSSLELKMEYGLPKAMNAFLLKDRAHSVEERMSPLGVRQPGKETQSWERERHPRYDLGNNVAFFDDQS